MAVCGLVLSLLYTLLIHENDLTHLDLSLVYKASEVVYWPLAQSFLGVGYRWINARLFEWILEKLVRDRLANQLDSGISANSPDPCLPLY